ncbi:hypothetical protein ACVWYH_003381 [Bradyrhizobium sp. GM24.11]
MMKNREDVGLAETTLADDHDGAALTFVHGFDGFQNVVRGIRYVEKRRRRDLNGTGAPLVGQFDHGPL